MRFVSDELSRHIPGLQRVDQDSAGRGTNGDDVTAMGNGVTVVVVNAVGAVRQRRFSFPRPLNLEIVSIKYIIFDFNFRHKLTNMVPWQLSS